MYESLQEDKMDTRLQLALDDISFHEAVELVEEIHSYIDIVEIGTPFLMEYGTMPVREMKKRFPDLEVLFDSKIMDAGCYEARTGFLAGADYVTVLGVTDDATIAEVARTAREMGRKTMVDMICVQDFQARIPRLEELGADLIAIHTGVDQQALGRTPLDDLEEMRKYVKKAGVAVAGGISCATIDACLEYRPDIVIAGSGIVHAEDPAAAAAEMKMRIRNYPGRTGH